VTKANFGGGAAQMAGHTRVKLFRTSFDVVGDVLLYKRGFTAFDTRMSGIVKIVLASSAYTARTEPVMPDLPQDPVVP